MNGKHDNGGTPWYVLNAPEVGGAFQRMERLLQQNSVLESKTDSLVRLALTVVCREHTATEQCVERALKKGASREEITEVFLLAAAQCAKSHLTWATDISRRHLLDPR